MSDTSDMAALLAALTDEDLLAVVVTATTGRPGLEQLRLVAAELSAGGGGGGGAPPGGGGAPPPPPPPGRGGGGGGGGAGGR
ncbi:hypothetical protein, partial [Nocardia wallacei]|uniref:hypothetical protein n=1 Tax=Nocardia wallacei TaxID=480035 RepID=UPI003CC7F496